MSTYISLQTDKALLDTRDALHTAYAIIANARNSLDNGERDAALAEQWHEAAQRFTACVSGWAEQDRAEQSDALRRTSDALHTAFGIIANARNCLDNGERDPVLAEQWHEAAQRFMDDYNTHLDVYTGYQVSAEPCNASCGNSVHMRKCQAKDNERHVHVCFDCGYTCDDEPDDAPLIDPDCRDGKHSSCVGGPCECPCHELLASTYGERLVISYDVRPWVAQLLKLLRGVH